jgi:hypothetical protein
MPIKDKWGDTAPFLAIAKHYNLPYALVLFVADWFQHGRSVTMTHTRPFAGTFAEADYRTAIPHIRDVSQRFRDMRDAS